MTLPSATALPGSESIVAQDFGQPGAFLSVQKSASVPDHLAPVTQHFTPYK
jgi:hypothetical protein